MKLSSSSKPYISSSSFLLLLLLLLPTIIGTNDMLRDAVKLLSCPHVKLQRLHGHSGVLIRPLGDCHRSVERIRCHVLHADAGVLWRLYCTKRRRRLSIGALRCVRMHLQLCMLRRPGRLLLAKGHFRWRLKLRIILHNADGRRSTVLLLARHLRLVVLARKINTAAYQRNQTKGRSRYQADRGRRAVNGSFFNRQLGL